MRNWDAFRIYDEEVHKVLQERFAFMYIHMDISEDLPVKVSVSELKKRSYAEEQDKEEAVVF